MLVHDCVEYPPHGRSKGVRSATVAGLRAAKLVQYDWGSIHVLAGGRSLADKLVTSGDAVRGLVRP